MKFDLTDLRIFLSAVEGGSLTAAALQNNIVVAAVSARLRKMEDSFGLPLVERTGRGIRPTLAGDILVGHARKVLDDTRKLEIELDAFSEGRGGTIRLLSNTNMLSEHMPKLLGSFLRQNPDIFVTVTDKPSMEVVNLLRNGEADIGIVASSADMTGLERWRFVPDRLVLIVPGDWALEGPVAYARILDHPLIALNTTVALSQFLRRLATELGRRANIRIRVENFESLCRIVECGAGLGIVPESAARRYGRDMGFRTLEIADGWAERELYVCVRNQQQLPLYAQKLLLHFQTYAEEAKNAAFLEAAIVKI
ncbi:LysR family transcriptional regulator [Aliirhizobium cellulosilyticum]|uniref:DNA-binding transcriptional LysR family regulator n=1 Tax=Aliirhizobium cellulosilyticum TaxID=393664 RepID=A0A7W6SBE2_9HYPH|nr:LysR family transcriptional regulator [Rhizobium cellulosilyticum]MBB4349963.1 DNA-binding transcriptional LysR family regulator [Rhizobium cellulosilyticum]MBB4413142.1 DNA-binding transcriptional LysR family regulator [Rhizobium cellulosilyticum]MBB4447920.1 DNA-binding transcriptional LysR family regulator [Rhizobium cellulosilyticum]